MTGCFFAKAQQNPIANSSPLRIPEIMEGDRFVGFLPQQISWSENNETVYFSWNPEMDTIRSIFKVNRSGASPEVVSVDELKNRIERGTYTRDYSAKVFVKNGDLFLWESQTNTAVQLTNTIDAERSPQFAKKDTWIVYRSGNNLFAWDRQSGAFTQLTNIQTGNARRGTILSDQQQWLDQQQDDLFDVLQWQEAQATARQNQRNALAPERPEPFYLGRKRISRIVAGPDARFVAMVLMTAADSKGTKVPNYVSSNGYIQDLRSRAKVGGPQNTYSLHLYDRLRDTFYRVSHHNLPGIYDKPAYLREYHSGEKPYVDTFASPRPVNFTQPIFSESGQAVLVVRSQDNKDRWIVSLNPETGTLKSLDHQRDDAWVAGPGIGWSFAGGTLGWMNDGKTVYFQSEETGYAHLYLMNTETGEKKALTQGAFEILSARLSRDGKTFYVRSNAESPHQQHFYHLRVDDAKMVKITDQPGNYEVTMSPDESHLAIRYSYSNKPWELFIMKNEPQAKMIQVTTSTTQAFQAYPWRDPEIIRFTARDGAQVPARLYRPENAVPGGPAVIFVHGAGYLQNVHQCWSSYFREYMFHNILVDNGYTVLDIDYRASAGYGRDWRTAIYRHMGGMDLSDQVDGAKYLTEKIGIDAQKIGIYGGSYGGFITLMALFTEPGTFAAGAALRSVTDWAHYNHGFTSNILNTPVLDSLAYARSSPINFAEGLEDQLLILHGMIDTNVQFQDVVRLAQRLIELGKDNWEFAVFPVERHGFVTPSSWSDEYKRIFKLFQENLK